MESAIKLMIGLANPGLSYVNTRHNAGAWLIETIIQQEQINLRHEKKFYAQIACLSNPNCYLAIPTTYMNHSGQAVQAIAHYYNINPENILIIHDDLDLPPGVVRLKYGGGDGGHNGLKSIMSHLSTKSFSRLRVGIGHPGKTSDVSNYVLGCPNRYDGSLIKQAINTAVEVLPLILEGNSDKAMQKLHRALPPCT